MATSLSGYLVRRCARPEALASTAHRPYPGLELGVAPRRGQAVVRARLQRGDPIARVEAQDERDDPGAGGGAPQLAKRSVGHHDHLGVKPVDQAYRRGRRVGGANVVSVARQETGEPVGITFVQEQYTHVPSMS